MTFMSNNRQHRCAWCIQYYYVVQYTSTRPCPKHIPPHVVNTLSPNRSIPAIAVSPLCGARLRKDHTSMVPAAPASSMRWTLSLDFQRLIPEYFCPCRTGSFLRAQLSVLKCPTAKAPTIDHNCFVLSQLHRNRHEFAAQYHCICKYSMVVWLIKLLHLFQGSSSFRQH